MSFVDKILGTMKLSDEDDDYLDDMEELEEERTRSAKKNARYDEPAEEPFEEEIVTDRAPKSRKRTSNVISMQDGRKPQAELCTIKPKKMEEDSREICDILQSGKAVIINFEGVKMDLAQRILDFVSGATYAMRGNLQKVSNTIIVATPSSIALSGDFQDIVEDSVGLNSFNNTYGSNQ